MSVELPGAEVPEAGYCRYHGSRLQCRGPERQLNTPYVAFLGGAETFGRFVRVPFVEQIERATGRICVNLGASHTGPEAWLQDAALVEIAARASRALIQLSGAQMLCNPYYRVHPRRNDRFLEPLPPLADLYPEIDFTDFAFVNHMLAALNATSPDRFAQIREALQEVWVARMAELLDRFARPPVLLWLRYTSMTLNRGCPDLALNPVFVTGPMIECLRVGAGPIVTVDLATASAAREVVKMRFGPMQAPAAAQMIGPSAHRAVARALIDVIGPAE
ncbi:DUF6473 family protein [Seohaeicola nanhaiensis]|uniref:DUF6473 family protein n=1 Tax=Seohaeicola nanhaiensis TaxID=1387282 RepID=A0ABV9KNY9_9RHOB